MRVLTALLGLMVGYVVVAFIGYGATSVFSGNHFDGSVEAAMTAASVFGPAGALMGCIAGLFLPRRGVKPLDKTPGA